MFKTISISTQTSSSLLGLKYLFDAALNYQHGRHLKTDCKVREMDDFFSESYFAVCPW